MLVHPLRGHDIFEIGQEFVDPCEGITTPYSSYWTQKANTSAGKLAQFQVGAIAWEQSQISIDAQIASIWSDIQQLSAINTPTQAELNLLTQRYQDLSAWRATQQSARTALINNFRSISEMLPTGQVFEANQRQVSNRLTDWAGCQLEP